MINYPNRVEIRPKSGPTAWFEDLLFVSSKVGSVCQREEDVCLSGHEETKGVNKVAAKPAGVQWVEVERLEAVWIGLVPQTRDRFGCRSLHLFYAVDVTLQSRVHYGVGVLEKWTDVDTIQGFEVVGGDPREGAPDHAPDGERLFCC